ncbi:MAG: hypothetical protein LAT81_14945, partial [Oceanicaulis sp.]|nr:hypothetical protein [Oceanicaulis sp.]
YTMWVASANDRNVKYSQDVIFNIDYREQIEETHLIYRNSLGGIEVFRATGEANRNTERQSRKAKVLRGGNYAATDHHAIETNITTTEGLEINTGYKSKSEMRQFVELATSDKVWLIGRSRFIPVTLEIDTAALEGTESGRLNNADFTILFTTEKGFTNV